MNSVFLLFYFSLIIKNVAVIIPVKDFKGVNVFCVNNLVGVADVIGNLLFGIFSVVLRIKRKLLCP